MSADNEIVIAEFTDCWTVSMQFASDWWTVALDDESDEEEIRARMKGVAQFSSEEAAEKFAEEWEDRETIVEYGISYSIFPFPLNP